MNKHFTLLLFIGLAWGQGTIAVFDFDNINISKSDAQILTDRLRTEIVQLKTFKVVERSKINDLLKEQKFQMSGCVEECLIEVGEMLGATSVITGSIGSIGLYYTINAQIINVTISEIENAISYDSRYSINDMLIKGMNAVASQLMG